MHPFGLLTTLAAALWIGGAAPATGPEGHEVVRQLFAMADADANGRLTPSEYRAAGLARYGVSFEDCDADADGETTLDEYLALYDRHHPRHDRVGL